jgi:hypothetical protein
MVLISSSPLARHSYQGNIRDVLLSIVNLPNGRDGLATMAVKDCKAMKGNEEVVITH